MKNKKQGSLIINMTSYAFLQIVNMIVGLFLPRLYLAVYGSEVNGIISTINSFISYFSYIEAGIGLTLIHSLFKPLAEDDIDKTNGILSYSKKQYQKISYIYFALVVGLSLTFPLFNHTEALSWIEFVSLVFVIGLYGAADFFTMSKYRVLLTADRREYVISNAMILAQILRFVFVWILLQFNISVVIVKIVPILTLFIRSLILRIYIRLNYPEADYGFTPANDVSITKDRFDALLLQISINASVSLPTIIISQILGFKEANVYAVYSLVASAVISIVSSLSSGASPKIGMNIARGVDINDSYNIYAYLVSLVISIAFSVMAVMMIPFVELYTSVVDDINYIHPTYAILISIWAALYSYRIPLTAVINAVGIYRKNRINNIVNLCVQIIAGIVFALIWGIVGILAVMIFASIHRNISYSLVNSKILINKGLIKSVIHQLGIVFTICASYIIAVPLINRIQFNVLYWIIAAFITAIIVSIIASILFIIFDFSSAKQLFQKSKDYFKIKRKI